MLLSSGRKGILRRSQGSQHLRTQTKRATVCPLMANPETDPPHSTGNELKSELNFGPLTCPVFGMNAALFTAIVGYQQLQNRFNQKVVSNIDHLRGDQRKASRTRDVHEALH